jgi:hypothetical protein
MGPHLVILANPTAVNVTDITPWIRHSWIKKAAAPADPNDWQAAHDSSKIEVSENITATRHHLRELQLCSSHFLKLVSQLMVEA